MSTIPVITIDGPGGSGKGTVAARVAERLGYHLLDSGALYRLLGYAADQQNLDLSKEDELFQLAKKLKIEFGTKGPGSVLLDGQEVSRQIRSDRGGELASVVAAIPAARAGLMQRQLEFRKAPGLVADGRDMGTTVFPDARVKIYLTASVEERANRRYKQLIGKGIDAMLPDLFRDLTARDERDRNRTVSPLTPADDAFILDSTTLTIDQVVEQVLQLARQSEAGK